MENYHLTQVKTPLFPVYTQNQLHGFVMSGFKQKERVLWTHYTNNNQHVFIILSKEVPDYKNAGESVTKDYTTVLNAIKDNMNLRFRLVANPTKRVNGKNWALRKPEEMIQWLNRKQGFELTSVDITKKELLDLHHRNCGAIKFSAVTFEGVLKVTDAKQFKKVLTYGIGREKAYGMGLMQVGLI